MNDNRPTPPVVALKPVWGFSDYAWFIVKNVIGWLFVLGSGPIGMFIPGPGGLPLFIIGFALITFPGKRRLTARVLRGIPVDPNNRAYRIAVGVIAITVPAGLILTWLRGHWWPLADPKTSTVLLMIATYLSSVVAIWSFGLLGVDLINMILSLMPRARRKVRPWMRRKGLDLLPPRRRFRLTHPHPHLVEPDTEILEIHARHHERLRRAWAFLKPWLIRALRVAIIAAILFWMLRPIVRRWDQVHDSILNTNPLMFALAAVMFALFLFVFRTSSWRMILRGFGHPLPVPPATRIWSFSELARYIPGVIWQVVGRAFLAKPYGVPPAVSSASQILEICIFVLANVIVALSCLLVAGLGRIPTENRWWLYVAAAAVPILLTLLHPRVFYSTLNLLMKRLNKPPIAPALRKRKLTLVAMWNILGLLWQTLAIWVLTSSVLHLPIDKWYVLAGAYCLAWTIGFSCAFLMPGGLGVREAVFITTLQFTLPPAWVATHFPDTTVLTALAAFLSVLLRLWTISGELLLAGLAYLLDRHPPPAQIPVPLRP